VVHPSVYSRSACLPSTAPPLQPGGNYWRARVGYHPPAPRCRPVPPIEISCAVGSGRFSLSPRSNWERREGTGSHRSRFVLARRGLYSPQLNKWITGFAPLAKQIRRDPSWPPPACPRPSGLRPQGIYCRGLPCHAFIPYDTTTTAAAAQHAEEGTRYLISVKAQHAWLLEGLARWWPWQWRSKRASPARMLLHGESSPTRAGECVFGLLAV
jgi:hypothetical protein